MCAWVHTSVDDVVVVQVVDSLEDLSDSLGSVLLRELSLLANAVEQLAACGQLGHDVIFILPRQLLPRDYTTRSLTRDSNQSWNLTMCGWCMR
jgi:hypothetical protein